MWLPHVTVAGIVEREGRFLLVEEITPQGKRFNQPAGHWEQGETLLAGVVREVLEETAYTFTPQALLGVYSWQVPDSQITYLRFAFIGEVCEPPTLRAWDEGILQVLWLSLEDLRARATHLRSPQVLRCVEDYLSGQRYPLSLITHIVG